MEIDPEESYIDDRAVTFVWGWALVMAAILLVTVLLGVRLYHKAGADIQNPIELHRLAIAQERIAAALEGTR